MTDLTKLAALGMWPETVYRDLLDVERGALSEADFRARHIHRKAVLEIDSIGLTSTSLRLGEVAALRRILRFQQVCAPVLADFGAELTHAFADNLTVLFDSPTQAIDAAFALHTRLAEANTDDLVPQCGIGIGYGDVFAIGPNLAMGDEMNKASKLGEDTAESGETLLTDAAFQAVKDHPAARFTVVAESDLPFPYARAEPAR
ncbi:nucleotidyl cyclase domain-containing protein [Actinokineospora iranica]|uniref:hypothetical protein n=1 Tax=Actinokineospora iranica TaxID=1271860 RepID=UPI001113C75D|nr:hypothetical protein [Actinokineospora iranica]